MNRETKLGTVDKKKLIPIIALYAMSVGIIVLGFSFSIYSVVYGVSIKVLSSDIHGMVFGIVILYLGFRYYFSVNKLKNEVFKVSSVFRWNNFRTVRLIKSKRC